MTRKKAIKVVATNLEMGWLPPNLDWTEAVVCETSLSFRASTIRPEDEPWQLVGTWHLPRRWLEKEGYL